MSVLHVSFSLCCILAQEQVDDAQKRADKVEKLYNDQLHDQLIRKREQDKELSERESKILDLR